MSAAPDGLDAALAGHGLLRFATVVLAEGEIAPAPGRPAPHAAAIVGNAGSAMWEAFRAGRGATESLDAWTRRAIEPIAARLGAEARFAFDGPPFLPIQALARRSSRFHASPLGLTIHAEFGLWHAFRAALLFADAAADAVAAEESPCARCAGRPCLTACPVRAFDGTGYDVAACRRHLDAGEPDCISLGCRARRACPVGAAFRYDPAHAAFHMRAFRAARPRQDGARAISSLRRAT
jgi:hypothetical protein